MSSKPALRFLPWGRHLSHASPQRLPRIAHTTRNPDVCRYASTAPSSKPKALGKPSKFIPPSHPAQLKRDPPVQYPGPPISPKQKEKQKTKRYPNMFPTEGTFMHWFLTNRSIHVWITLSTLFSLALFTFITDFHRTSPFADLLPRANTFLSHPIAFISKCLEVYKLHTEHVSAVTAERRRKIVDDVVKRSAYRKAHGLDKDQGFGGWTARGDEDALGHSRDNGVQGGKAGTQSSSSGNPPTEEGVQQVAYADWEGRRRPVKRWLGIWE